MQESLVLCDVSCQKDHRKSHRKECKRIEKELNAGAFAQGVSEVTSNLEAICMAPKSPSASEGQSAGSSSSVGTLWNPTPRPDCPLCYLPMPIPVEHSCYLPCCGTVICTACFDEGTSAQRKINIVHDRDEPENITCPFCRSPLPMERQTDVLLKRYQTRMDKFSDHQAFHKTAYRYEHGLMGFRKDAAKALELYRLASDLGSSVAADELAQCYEEGRLGLERSYQKAKEYRELAASRGHVGARHELGAICIREFNLKDSYRHYAIAAGYGLEASLRVIKEGLLPIGAVSPADVTKVEKAYLKAVKEMQSEERDKAAQDTERIQ